MSSTSQALFYMAVCMGLVILWGAWRRFYWADKFFMQARHARHMLCKRSSHAIAARS